jgi:hypothetical protein
MRPTRAVQVTVATLAALMLLGACVSEPAVSSRYEGSAHAWPTLAIVDPRGNVAAFDSGEIPLSGLDDFIGNMEERFDELGLMDRSGFELSAAPVVTVEPLLLYPGKVLADPEGGRLFISDTNHNRVIIASLETGDILDVIGSGVAGFQDGTFATSSFNKPQGLALVDGNRRSRGGRARVWSGHRRSDPVQPAEPVGA